MKGKKLLIIILSLFVILVGYRITKVTLNKKNTKGEVAILPVEVVIITPTDYDETLNLTGTILAENQTEVPAKVPGKIIKYLFEEGDWVNKGQNVVTIDRDEIGVEFKEAVLDAPIAGWMTKKYFDTGTHVNPGQPLFQIADYHQVKLMVQVPEVEISRVKKGAVAKVSIDAWPDQQFTGWVSKLSPTVDNLSRTAKAEIAIRNPGLKIRPGMYARATVNIKRHLKGIVIPTTAILQREGATQIFVVEGGNAVARAVTVDIDLGETSSIKSGLALGEQLIVAGHHSLSNGSVVKVIGGK